VAIKANGLFFQEKEKRLSESKYCALAESHVPCFQERVGTRHPGYMIPNRLPWRLRARPSATLHEIQVRPTNERQNELVPLIIQTDRSAVKYMLSKRGAGAPCLAAFARHGTPQTSISKMTKEKSEGRAQPFVSSENGTPEVPPGANPLHLPSRASS
jgi:hypothetical protein